MNIGVWYSSATFDHLRALHDCSYLYWCRIRHPDNFITVATSEAPTPDPAPNSATPAPLKRFDVPAEVPADDTFAQRDATSVRITGEQRMCPKDLQDDLAMTYRALRNVATQHRDAIQKP